MHCARILIALACLSLAGCATPDVKPFAEQTAALTNAVLEERKATVEQFDALLVLIEKGKAAQLSMAGLDGADWAQKKKKYVTSMKVVTEVLSEAKTYADEVASLAAAGETGGEAADKIYKTVKGFGSLVASAGGPLVSLPAELAGSVAGRVFREIGQAWTRYQAQASLEKATTEAQPALDKIADGLNAIFADIQKDLVFGLTNATANAQNRVYNNSAVKFHRRYNSNNELKAMVEGPLNLDAVRAEHCLKGFSDAASRIACLGGNAAAANVVRTGDEARINALAAEADSARRQVETVYLLIAALQETKEDYDRFFNARAGIKAWGQTRNARSKAIVAAIETWSTTHRDLTAALAQCGGLKALRASCGNLTVGNLKAAIERVKYVIGDE